MNSEQISKLREAVWQLTQAVGNVCDVLVRIEEETRYFESLQYQAMSASIENQEGTDNV